MDLFFHDFQHFHGAGLGADAAGDALGGGVLQNHDLHGACLHALAAGNTLLLIDHVNAGLGVLGNGLMLTGLHALAALDADRGFGTGTLGNDLDAGQIFVKFLVESLGTSADTLQACHTLDIFLNSKLFHSKGFPFSFIFSNIILDRTENSNAKKEFFQKM